MSTAVHDRVALAAEAFVYGYPLVANLDQVVRYTTTGAGVMPAAPFNGFSHGGRLAGPDDTFVSINNDTVYSFAQLDLGTGPLLFEIPDVGARYVVYQFVDAWTNNFAYLGTRATGSGASRSLIVPPSWSGQPPDGMTVIVAPTRVCSIVGRFACAGEDDFADVQRLQRQLVLAPYDEQADAASGVPEPDGDVPEEFVFFEKLRVWMNAFPPSAAERAYQTRFAPLGLLDTGGSPFERPEPDTATDLTAGLAGGKERLEEVARNPKLAKVNGWHVAIHSCDYNVDWLGPGTIDDPAWKLADREAGHALRAAVARNGLWGNHGYEATYYVVYEDGDGNQLNGGNTYRLHFEQPPPAKAFWSVTMYDMPDYFLVRNPIDRYSIGDRTAGLVYGDDGSLTIAIQREAPTDPTDRANWLPAPEGDFRPAMRVYNPRQEVLDGDYAPPPIVRG